MTKLLCITDIHGSVNVLNRILCAGGKSDTILLGGDITNFGTPGDAEHIVRQALQASSNVLAVAGNCDSAEIERRLVDLDVGIGGASRHIGGVSFHGLSGAPPWQPRMYEFSEEDLACALEAGSSDLDTAGRHVVLSHVPPHGCSLDRTFLWRHVGSTALRDFIAARQPDLVVCGHIHEARGVEQLGRTIVVNCGSAARGYFALVEIDQTVRVTLHRV